MSHSTCLRHHRNWALVLLCTGGFVSAAAAATQDQPESRHGETYGIAQNTVLRIPAAGFLPFHSGQGFLLVVPDMQCTAPAPLYALCSFLAPVQLPAGAQIMGFEMEACDNEPTDLGISGALLRCNGPAPCEYFPVLSEAAQSGCAYTLVDLTSSGLNVDNYNNNYFFQYSSQPSPNLTFRSVLIYYRLQLSTPPDTATFSDVPVGDLRRQYVEALAAAGISAGCGGGKYCPDDPVTRGQLAVFLAKALGLHFPF
jgi:hypothetical protein